MVANVDEGHLIRKVAVPLQTEQPASESICPQPDQREGPGIAHHGADPRSDEVAPHQQGKKHRQQNVESDKRGEGDRRAAGKSGCYPVRRTGQAPQPVRDVSHRAPETGGRPKHFLELAVERQGNSSFEHLGRRLLKRSTEHVDHRPSPLQIREPGRSGPSPFDRGDDGRRAQRGYDIGQMFHIRDLDIDQHLEKIDRPVGDLQIADVALVLADDRRQ